MSEVSYDAIIIGAGHNGLVCATYLAGAGRKGLMREANEQVGGAACHEGYQSCFFRRVQPGESEPVIEGERVFDPKKVYKKS